MLLSLLVIIASVASVASVATAEDGGGGQQRDTRWPWSKAEYQDPPWADEWVEEECEYSKYDIYMCVDTLADVAPHDHNLTLAEVDAALDGMPHAAKFLLLKMVGGLEVAISHCARQPGYVTREDYFARRQCMRLCADRLWAMDLYCIPTAKRRGIDLMALLGKTDDGRRRAALQHLDES